MGNFRVTIFVLGKIALFLDLGGRLFDTYSRIDCKASWLTVSAF